MSDWIKDVTNRYYEKNKLDKNYTFKHALKELSAERKKQKESQNASTTVNKNKSNKNKTKKNNSKKSRKNK